MIGITVALICVLGMSTHSPIKKPNVIIILSDDAGYADFGFTGLEHFDTPNIDRLAAEGVVCTSGYVTASVCCPSRAGLLTGRYQQRFGHEFNNFAVICDGYSPEDMGLDVSEKTIGDLMQAQGYKTMALGKWHMGDLPRYHPNNRGFDEFYGFLGGNRSYFPYPKGKGNGGQVMYHNKRRVDEPTELTYVTDDLTSAALNFIRQNKDNSFCIYLAYNAPHTPNEAKEEHLKKLNDIKNWRRKSYAAMTISMDENIGRIQKTLRELDIEKNTLLIFVNDNGGATNNGSDNGQYRGMKGSKWEGGIRVPFIFTWPGTLPAGVSYDQPVSALDLVSTSLAVAGGNCTDVKKLDGVNLIPYLQGKDKTSPHEILFWRRGVAAAVRRGKWKLIRSMGNPNLLFNLDKDASETVNVADKHPEVVRELLEKLKDWESELAPPKWKEGQKWENFQFKKHRMEVNTRKLERKYP